MAPAFKNITAALTLVAAATTAQAGIIQYQFSGTYVGESNVDQSVVAANDYLFGAGTLLASTFFYDNSAAAIATNVQDSGGLATFGLFSAYDGAISAVEGSVEGYGFNSVSGITLVANSNPGDTTYLDGVFNLIGSVNADGLQAGTGFQGFALGDYTLQGVNFFRTGDANYLPSQALPDTLSNSIYGAGAYLTFADTQHNVRMVQFSGAIAEVPEPASGVLLGSGLIGLILSRRKRFHKS
jgi:hypothetical protein